MPRMRRNRKRETMIMIGVKRSIVQIICSFVIIENASAMGMINIPIAKITKTAGPSPAELALKLRYLLEDDVNERK